MPPRKTRNTTNRQMFKSIDDVKEVLDTVESLKVKSVKTYINHLRLFMREMKIDNVYQLLNDYEKTDEYIQNKTAERTGRPITLETMRTYYVTLNSVAGHVDFVKATAKQFWQSRQDEYNKKAHDERAKNRILEKHQGNPPKWADLKDLSKDFTGTARYNSNHLLVSLYTLIAPRRGEYRTLYYLDKKPLDATLKTRPRKATNDIRDSNRIPWNCIYPNDDGTYNMILRDYKTNQTYDVYEKTLPADLSKIIKGFIEKQDLKNDMPFFRTNREPRDTGEPFRVIKENNWTKKITSAFALKYDKHSIAIDELRHAYINSLKLNDMTTAQKEAIALDMGHSTKYQDLYRQYIADDAEAQEEPDEEPEEPRIISNKTLQELYAMLGKIHMEARKVEALIEARLKYI